MRLPMVPRKYRAFAYLCVILIGLFVVLLGSSTKKILRGTPPSEPTQARDAELEKIELALSTLKSLEGRVPLDRGDDRTSTSAIFPEGVKAAVPSDEAKSVSSIDPSSLSVVITQSSQGRSIYLDGVRVKRGDTVQGGMTVRDLGASYFVLEDSAGERRRIDVTDRLSVVAKDRKAEVKK